MIPGISSQIFLPHKLTTAMLGALRDGGAHAIELFSARWHVDYTDRQQMRDIGSWFKGNDVVATMHAPLTAETYFSRHASPSVNLVDADRGRRILAMDEVKRALEMAEQVPIKTCVLHVGLLEDRWSERVLETALTSLEHLQAFAGPLGVKLLLQNLRTDVATPEHLLEVLRVGHFDSFGICLDTGHAHLAEGGLAAALEVFEGRIAEVHINDNSGKGDEHFWPASGTERPAYAKSGIIDWPTAYAMLPPDATGILEVSDTQAGTPAEVSRMLAEVLSHQARLLEEAATGSAS